MTALIICMLIAVSDQLTKVLVRESLYYGQIIPVVPGFFNLTFLKNTGAAWGILGGQNVSLTILSVVMLFVMVFFRRSFLSDTRLHRIALGLLTGGIVGNMIDRIKWGAVTDFLDFYVGSWHWPAFNIADSAICVGVGIYIVTTFLEERKNKALSQDAAA